MVRKGNEKQKDGMDTFRMFRKNAAEHLWLEHRRLMTNDKRNMDDADY